MRNAGDVSASTLPSPWHGKGGASEEKRKSGRADSSLEESVGALSQYLLTESCEGKEASLSVPVPQL